MGVEPEVGEEFAALCVFDESIGNAETVDAAGVEAEFGGGFQESAAEATHQASFFHGDDEAGFAKRTLDHLAIERLDEASVDDADIEPFFAEFFSRP